MLQNCTYNENGKGEGSCTHTQGTQVVGHNEAINKFFF